MNGRVKIARVIAKAAHSGWKYGNEPYFNHVRRVADNFVGKDELRIIGYLHDVIEDSDVTKLELMEIFGVLVANAVDAITRRDGEAYADYILRVQMNPMATVVKIADLEENLSHNPEGNLEDRYRKALKVLRE